MQRREILAFLVWEISQIKRKLVLPIISFIYVRYESYTKAI